MATQKIQTYAIFDRSSVANYKATCLVIGSALTSLGWVPDTSVGIDPYAVTWGNVASVPPSNSTGLILAPPNPRGAWSSAGNAYAVGDMVTNGGLTYISQTAIASFAVTQAIQNTAQSFAMTSVAGSGVYTKSGATWTTNQWAGFVFVVSSFAVGANNGTFICTANTATSLTLSNASSAVDTTGTAASSASNIGYAGTFGALIFSNNIGVGHSILFSGFAASSGVNNGALLLSATSTTYVGGVKTGTNETITAAGVDVTAPGSDLNSGSSNGHWAPYNFEIWVSSGPLSATNPVYLKVLYGVSSSGYLQIAIGVGTGQAAGVLTGNVFNGGTLVSLTAYNGAADKGGSTYECSFCGTADKVSWILWRQAGISYCSVVSIDRAHDQNGVDLGAYTTVLIAGSSAAKYQTLFKPGAGSVTPPAANSAWPCINDANASSAYNGMAPPYLCFPTPGYMANPILGAIAMHSGDMSEGSLITVIMYGAAHTFLMTANVSGPLAANSAAGIQWEVF